MKKTDARWHRLTVHAVEKELHTDASCGLSCKEARLRYRNNGANTLFDSRQSKEKDIFRQLIFDPAWLLLLLGCLIALCFGAFALTASILICASVGILFSLFCYKRDREYRNKLSPYRIPTVTVIRDGTRFTTSARGVVSGDLILLRSGDLVPCDCRLARSENLHVQTLSYDENGKPRYLSQEKFAKTLYGYDEEIDLPQAENMLCGGTKIIRGVAYAIAVATSSDCDFINGDASREIPAEKGEGRATQTSVRLQPYLRIYRFAIFAAFLPITVLGFLTAPAHINIISVFLSVCALTASAATSYLSLFFYECEKQAERAYFTPSAEQNRVIFKSKRASAALSQITDLFVMGHCATSDGRTHLLRAWLGDGEVALDLDSNEPHSELGGLAEAFCLLNENATHELSPENLLVWKEAFSLSLLDILHFSGYDSEALLMRTLETKLLPSKSDETQTLEVRMHDKTQRILFSSTIELINYCTCYEKNGEILPLDPIRKKALIAEIDGREEQNSSLQIVLRKHGCDLCLVGVAAFGEQAAQQLPGILQSLSEMGIRTTVFLKGTRQEEARYVADLVLPTDFSYFEKKRSNQLCEDGLIEKYRVLQGFTAQEVGELIAKMKKNGRKIAVMSVERGDEILLQSADLFITCDDGLYHENGPSNTIFELFSRDGARQSRRASQSMRRTSDLLVCRADRDGGGLFAVFEARLASQAINVRTRAMISFLLFSQIARLVATVFAVATGLGLLNGILGLYCGLVLETLGVFLILSAPISSHAMHQEGRMPHKLSPLRALHNKESYFTPALSVFCTMLLIAILTACRVINSTESVSVAFVSLTLAMGVHLCIQITKLIPQSARLHYLPRLLLLFILPAVACILSVLFSTCNRLLGVGAWSPVSIFLLPVMPLLSLLFGHLFSRK